MLPDLLRLGRVFHLSLDPSEQATAAAGRQPGPINGPPPEGETLEELARLVQSGAVENHGHWLPELVNSLADVTKERAETALR